ncbi:MAG: hypothetical protein JW839_04160, partial [Candidatus Lokiarchaeota archaeon]|nr:hypothetical protein [Candidatus Lokiarchaeota archaeon]
AYVGDGASGLQCINITNPASPSLLGTFDTPGIAHGIFVSGDVAYIADASLGLWCINITNPASPSLLGTSMRARNIFVSGDIAYIASESLGLNCIDVAWYPWEDTLPPSNPLAPCMQTVPTTMNGTWQSAVSDPAFSWDAASDGNGSGVAGYHVYWGIDPHGEEGTFQTGTTYDPGVVTSGTYYLRVQARDLVGNNASSWTTLYEFRYDCTEPANPTGPCTQLVPTTASGTWQSAVSDPAFSWNAASDGNGSGVAGYYVCWGINPAGTSSTFITEPTFDPGTVSSGTYYLRVKSRDVVGNNASSWMTLYVFCYDDSPPANPTSPCMQNAGTTTSGTWQSTVSDPAFSWDAASDDNGSGVAGYYVYWGNDPAGTSGAFQTGTTYDPGVVTSGTYYLRVMTRDNLGSNATSWVTLYVFRYDSMAATNPSSNELNAFIQGIIVASSIAGTLVVIMMIYVRKLKKVRPNDIPKR